jgi:Protein of unknown function (DUF3106)
MKNPRIGVLTVVLLAGASGVFAQAHGGAMPNRVPPPKPERAVRPQHPLDRWAAMSPAQRDAALAKLPPERAQNIKARLAKWADMTEEQKDRVRNLTPEQRQTLTAHAQWMQTLPQERRQAVRKQVNLFQQMSPEARQAEIESPSFTRRFDAAERDHIKQVISTMPVE